MRGIFAISLVLASGPWLFGGQSIQVSNTSAGSDTFSRPGNLPSRVEFYLHDWDPAQTGNSFAVRSLAIGMLGAFISSGGLRLQIYNQRESGSQTNNGQCQIPLFGLPSMGVYVRYQFDPANKTDYCEAWDTNGNRFFSNRWASANVDTVTVNTGAQVGGGVPGQNRSIAFFRICSNVVPLNSRMPVTADTSAERLLDWKFDGNLFDSSNHGWTASMSSGAPTYVPTPNQNVIAVLKTANAPGWSNWSSLRAGFPAQLDGSSSLSQSDPSTSVTCFWQVLSGPSVPEWNDQTSCTPQLDGLVFGSYNFQLVATDATGAQATQELTVGAVATDSNGVIVQANPDADRIYGPMIAFGKNPWGYQDNRAMKATTLRSAYYTAQGLDPAPWDIARPGTVAWNWWPFSSSTTTLNMIGGMTPSTMTLTVTDLTKIDYSDFPTFVWVGGSLGYANEEIQLCSVDIPSKTFTVCYDGRAQHWNTGGSTWANGTTVIQAKIAGTGTTFLSVLCPAGAGWPGPVKYSAGTVTLTAGSTAATGNGTTWNTANGVNGGKASAIRVAATHAAGTPFVFMAYVAAVGGVTSITLDRAYPADADTGTFSYSIIQPDYRKPVVHYARADGSDGPIVHGGTACGSDVGLYVYTAYDASAYNNSLQTGRAWSYQDGNWVGDFGPNFYDEGLAHYALYLRSGWQPALDAFRKLEGTEGGINKGWMFYPELAEGTLGNNARRLSVLGAAVAAILDGKVSNWSGLRDFAAIGASQSLAPCFDRDLRETSLQQSWLAIAATFDPDLTRRAGWLTNLATGYPFDLACTGGDGSFPTPLWNYGQSTGSPNPLTVTAGSTAVTGTGILPAACEHDASLTGLGVANGSDIVTGTGFIPQGGNRGILIDGTINGVAKLFLFFYIYDSPTQVHLSGMYPGDTATNLTGSIITNGGGMAIATGPGDPQLAKGWGCIWNSPTSITLDRPWDGPTSSAAYLWRASLGGVGGAGVGTQPYMIGIKTLQARLASNVVTETYPDLAANYAALAVLGAAWIKTTGFDPLTGGLYYARGYDQCEPIYAPSSQPDAFFMRNSTCSYSPSLASYGLQTSRGLSGEAQGALGVLYKANPTQANKDFGDQFYGSIWNAPGYQTGGVYEPADATGASNLTDNDLGNYKYTGFFLGVGMAHQWPAARLGGVEPAQERSVHLPFSLFFVPNAASFRIVLTTPSGKTTTVACPSSPCVITADARQGAHLMKLQYLDANSKVVAQSTQPTTVLVQ